ncbi:hypothetical protein J3458_021716 [Metarhizium acridum]|uniref:uncharacterized protein n=1 Tax=Metarhizium acridum TaxID=92637 RepID=UPI001C6AD88E|nr:hypothetical protein J3458_021716 [Metarhizium acridum]
MPHRDPLDPSNTTWRAYVRDAFIALEHTLLSARGKLLRDWVFVPLGIFAILGACCGVDVLFRRVSVSFPASVACLALLFAGLLLCEAVLGTHVTRRAVGVINVPADWSLRWIGLFFTPSFVTIPLSPAIGVGEVFKIIAVFVVGFAVMMVLAAYMTRGLQLVLGATKRSETERGDEMGRREHDEMPLHQRRSDSGGIASPPQLRLQQHHYSQSSPADGSVAAASSSSSLPDYPAQAPPPPARCALYAARLASHLDASILALVLLASIPVYYASGYAMPLHVAVTTLCYRLALATPGPWQRYLHPVLAASLLAVLVIWPLSLAHGSSLTAALRSYKTGANYTRLWSREPGPPLLPGAGDVFSTVLDASIVSLALPMFQHRRELKRHLATLAIPNVLISVGSVLSYPPVCRAIGIAPTRSLAFASRSLTLALATPATTNLGGDVHTVAALGHSERHPGRVGCRQDDEVAEDTRRRLRHTGDHTGRQLERHRDGLVATD